MALNDTTAKRDEIGRHLNAFRAVALTDAEVQLLRRLLTRAELPERERQIARGVLEQVTRSMTLAEIARFAAAIGCETELDVGGTAGRLPEGQVIA